MRVAVVGGGIAGLAAAHLLHEHGLEVVLMESTDQLGGKLRLDTVGGLTVDVGAEAILARRPEGVALAERVGLARTSRCKGISTRPCCSPQRTWFTPRPHRSSRPARQRGAMCST